MDGMEAVLDAPESVEVETVEPAEPVEKTGDVKPEDQAAKDDKAYKSWLKAQRDANPEQNGKYARQAKDNHESLRELGRIDPKGVVGVRETYALLDSVVHGDLKGRDAIGAIQDEIRSVGETDALLAAGDPKALDILGEGFNEGLAKLTPTILDRVRQSDPEAYAAAVLPHFVQALSQSELVRDYNGLVDVFNEDAPKWLTEDQKSQWMQEKMQKVTGLVGNMGKWLNAQSAKAGELKSPTSHTKAEGAKPSASDAELDTLRKEAQQAHWKTNISLGLDKHSDAKFDEVFRPYAKRLNLDRATATALKTEFASRVSKAAMKPGADGKPNAYAQQIGRYRTQSKPDPTTVLNYAKVEFDKHAKAVMEGLVNERYKSFLNGKPAPRTITGAKPEIAAQGVQFVSVKPANVDLKNTPLDWIHAKKYRTTDGKVVQVRR